MSGLPFEDRRFMRPLLRDLRAHIDAFTADLADGGGATRAARPAAVAWVYLSALAAWAEDHQLIDPYLRTDATPRDRYALVPGADSAQGRLARAFAALCAHPAAWPLLDPRYNPHVHDRARRPAERTCADLLDWWRKDAPPLRYEHPGGGPASVTGWLPGDLLQHLSDERRKGNALTQTPWWICNGILGRTLTPAAREFRDTTLKLIDPCCGTGNFLVQAVEQLWELYTTGTLTPRASSLDTQGVTGWTPVGPAEAARRILEGVNGCELDPLTAAVARLRVAVTLAALAHDAGALAGPLRLDRIPHDLRPRIVVGDSLLAGEVSAEDYERLRPEQAAIINLGTATAARRPAPQQLGLLEGADQ